MTANQHPAETLLGLPCPAGDFPSGGSLRILRSNPLPVNGLVRLRFRDDAEASGPDSVTLYVTDISTAEARGRVLAAFDYKGRELPAVFAGGSGPVFTFDPLQAVEAMLREDYRKPGTPLSGRLPFHYHAVPRGVRFHLGRVIEHLGLARRRGCFPFWPVEHSVETFRSAMRRWLGLPEPKRWPDGRRCALALTHDIDTRDGLLCAPEIAAAERDFGLKSTWFVTCEDKVVIRSALDRLASEGHEIGCHDLYHDTRIACLDERAIAARLDKCCEILRDYGVSGFRSPSLGRSDALFDALAGFFDYDSSVPDTDGVHGCCTVLPFRRGNLLEIPITMPMDATLLFRGFSAERAVHVWRKKLEWIKQVGGAAVLVIHPEPQFGGRREWVSAYRAFLDSAAADGDIWIAPMRDIAQRCLSDKCHP